MDRLTKMVGELRNLSLLEAGQMMPEFAIVDINYILRQVVGRSKPLADEKEIELCLNIVDDLPPVQADAVMVNQIVYNLLLNAIKYTAIGGCITVSAELTDKLFQICVADKGMGIAVEDQEHVFDYFYRVDPARMKQSGGTGLGLALVKQMTQAHGGQVKISSVVGQGSTFTVLLPNNTNEKRTVSP